MEIIRLPENEREAAAALVMEHLFPGADVTQKLMELMSGGACTVFKAEENGMAAVMCLNETAHRILLCAGTEEGMHALIEYAREETEKDHAARLSAAVSLSQTDIYRAAGFDIENSDGTSAEMEYLAGRNWLGKTVTVIVDHPYGSFHPHLPDVLYPLNAGYLKESMAEGELIDAYVYGISQPAEECTGIAIAAVYRKDDSRLRLIVAPAGVSPSHDEIIAACAFEEQYYDTRFIFADTRFEA